MTDLSTYWAAEKDPQELVRRAGERMSRHLKRMVAMGTADRTRRLMSAYYGRGVDGSSSAAHVTAAGQQGEFIRMQHNAIKPLVTQVLGLIAGSRPALKPVATNTDATSLAQSLLGDQIREHFERELNLGDVEHDCVRGGLLTSSFSLVQGWDRKAGEPVAEDPDTGKVVNAGDVEVFAAPWWRIAYDPAARRAEHRQWCIFKRPRGRHDLAAQYPAHADRLKQMGAKGSDWVDNISGGADFTSLDELFGDRLEVEDSVWLFELRHRPTAALPKGRIVRFVDADCVLYDSARALRASPVDDEEGDGKTEDVGYPYDAKELHAYEYCPERIVGTATGHSSNFDLCGIQQMVDVATSATATSMNMLGLPHIWPGPGGASGINPIKIANTGITVLESQSEPKVLQFQAVNPSMLEGLSLFLDLLRQSAALNKTVMGEPDKGMPASAQALQRAQAVQYHQTAQGEYIRLVSSNVTGILRLAQRFAAEPRIAEIAGASGRYEAKEWSKKDVAGVRRFSAEQINPMLRGYEARQSLAEKMAEHGWANRSEFLSVYTTGDTKQMLEGEKNQLELIAAHKNMLRDGVGLPNVDPHASAQAGEPVFVDDGKPHIRLLKTDMHWVAYGEYRSVLDSPEARNNPEVVAAVSGVLQETIRLWRALTPDELAACGGKPLPTQMMAMQGGPPMGPPDAGGPPGPGGPTKPGDDKGPGLVPKGPSSPPLPKPPQDPITGEKPGKSSLGGLNAA